MYTRKPTVIALDLAGLPEGEEASTPGARYVCVCMYVCIYIYIYVFIDRSLSLSLSISISLSLSLSLYERGPRGESREASGRKPRHRGPAQRKATSTNAEGDRPVNLFKHAQKRPQTATVHNIDRLTVSFQNFKFVLAT